MAAKIIGIYNTNSVESGVCRVLSRVNHSCLASAELVSNPELETQDLRAVRQIKQGEEVTANYADLEDGLNQAGIKISCENINSPGPRSTDRASSGTTSD